VVLADISSVTYMTAEGMAALVLAWRSLRAEGVDLALAGCGSAAMKHLRVSGVDSVMPCYVSLDEALTAYAPDP
jgi:stage II sporulation protein AA (anti-sigma F factor antagonist)